MLRASAKRKPRGHRLLGSGTQTARIELRAAPDFIGRIEAWRLSQPGPPTKTATILHLINLGMEAAVLDP